MIEIVESTLTHVRELRKSLREGDKQEVLAIGSNPDKAVYYSYKNSVYRRTALVNGKVAAMWGVGGTPLGNLGRPYLLTSTVSEEVSPLAFARVYISEVRKMQRLFPILENFVDAYYHGAIRMLRISGFTVDKPKIFGPGEALFRRFYCQTS